MARAVARVVTVLDGGGSGGGVGSGDCRGGDGGEGSGSRRKSCKLKLANSSVLSFD